MKAKIIGVLLLALLPVFAFATVASAQTFRSGQTANVANSENIDGSAFVAGSTVDVSGTVNGDLYCAGQTVTISGTVNGDVLCAGQTVTVSGTVSGSVRVAGQTVAVSGKVDGSVTAAGQTVTLEGAGSVGRDATLLGQTITVNGKVARDAVIASTTASVNATVGRNVTANVETLTLGKQAVVGGSVDYTSPQKLTQDDGATVAGKVTYTEQKPEQRPENNAGYNWASAVIWGLMLLVSAVLFALLFPRELHRTTDRSAASVPQALLAVGVGLVAGIVMPIVIVLLMFTVVGIPFALVVLLAWVLVLALSGAFAAYYLGRVLWRSQTNVVLTMLVGALVVVLLLAVPVLNVLVWLLAVWYGSGALLLQLQRLAVAPQYQMRPTAKSRARTAK